ncbi:hypothetical protein OGZ51_06410 [Lactococcus lactis]|uniref:Uncharacterized protein n=1 Tax=Lactococcus lactis TaxID=1358 RepID=A0A9X4NIR5_9LACT|nr:hypothetical protein [Lactococcus lactis]MDG4983778.1 hypothetical protein [Lactococcus lactis]
MYSVQGPLSCDIKCAAACVAGCTVTEEVMSVIAAGEGAGMFYAS